MKSIVVVMMAVLLMYGIAHAEPTVWYVHPDSALNTIQAGLDSCADNDIVLAGPGTYVENIVWPNTQGIHLISELGPDVTIIDGEGVGTVIACTTAVDSNTIIRSFTVRNGYIDTEGGAAIHCYGSPMICDNVVTGNVGVDGYAVWYDGAPTVVRNRISTNTGGGIGGSGSTIIETNIVEFNTGNGMTVSGVFSIRNNTVTHNDCRGIWVYGYDHFANNIISYNAGDGVYFSPGFLSDPSFTGGKNDRSSGSNVITHNGGYGIGGFSAQACKQSVIAYNGNGGILTFNAGIDSCTIVHNYGPGIMVLGPTPLDRFDTMHVHYCDIFDNNGFGIFNVLDPDTVVINAENSWWGDATGPYHPDSNPGGLGDSVSDYVDFTPWLTEPVGVKEEEAIQVERRKPSATIFSGPLQLPAGKNCRIFDITGRVVTPDKIRPGIYFIEVEGKITQKVVKVR